MVSNRNFNDSLASEFSKSMARVPFSNFDLIPRQDILKDKWSPALQIRTVLLSIQALLSAPNPDDPLANDVAQLWKQNEQQAIRTAKYVPSNVLFFFNSNF